MLKFYNLPPANGDRPHHAAIILHGLGDSGRGIISLASVWRSALPNTEFICPDAPFPFEGGQEEARQWFRLTQFTMQEMTEGTKNAAPYLNDFIDEIQRSRGLPAGKIALVGFSQGTIMSLYVAPRRSAAVAGILGYSGLLVGGDALMTEKKSSPPIMLIHGTLDNVVPYAVMEPSVEALKRADLSVETFTCKGIGHTVDENGLREGAKFLQRVLI